jgi:hypothetical protein
MTVEPQDGFAQLPKCPLGLLSLVASLGDELRGPTSVS